MRRGAPGFTLIEILMALMVLAVGLASVLAVFVAGVRSSHRVVDESAAALAASAALSRILSEDTKPPLGERDFLSTIELAREQGRDYVWITPFEGKKAIPVGIDMPESLYCWRARASRFRGDVRDPMKDTARRLIEGRVSDTQKRNPDSDELWRVTVEIYRSVGQDEQGNMDVSKQTPVSVYQTYVCTAHR